MPNQALKKRKLRGIKSPYFMVTFMFLLEDL